MPIERGRASDQIFEQLRRRIVDREWGDGEQFPTEKELAAQFDVSPNTVREAIRALSVIGLIEVRHGSGSYVSLSGRRVLSSSLGTLMQLENVSLSDVIALSRHLHERIAVLAVERADDDDIVELEASVEQDATEVAEIHARRVQRFLNALARSAHDPLLAGLTWALDRVVTETIAATYAETPNPLLSDLQAIRLLRVDIVKAIVLRDVEQTLAAMSRYFDASEKIATERSELNALRLSESSWASILNDLATGYASAP